MTWALRVSEVCPAAPAEELELVAARFSINTKLRLAHWLAQMAHESKGFEVTRESLNYSVAGLLATFGRHRISEADAERYGRTKYHAANQPAIANLVYGGEWGRRNLGNTEPGDGWKFIGRGFKQLTGRTNYTTYGHAMGMDLLDRPEQLEKPGPASLSAGWFWYRNKLNALADVDDLEAVTRRVNGGMNGLELRRIWLQRFKEAI